jgi:hypothetical protein
MLVETFINLTIVFLVTVVFGYILGLTITNVVDQRLSDISINLPKINLPRQNIYVNLDQGRDSGSKSRQLTIRNQFQPNSGQSFQLKSPYPNLKPLKSIDPRSPLSEGFDSNIDKNAGPSGLSGASDDDDESELLQAKQNYMDPGVYQKDFAHPKKPKVPVQAEQVESNQVGHIRNDATTVALGTDQSDQHQQDIKKCRNENSAKPPTVGCQSDADCNVVYGEGQNKCLSNNKCYCMAGSGLFCHYGPCYYKDPKDMTDRQLQKFKQKAKFQKMTVQDYVNWLNLFEQDLDQLAPRHLNNYLKIKKGIRLEPNDIPRDRVPPPMNAQDYFNQLYTLDDQVNIYSPEVSDTTGLQIPANYSDYSRFTAPQNLKHLNNRNSSLDQELKKENNRGVLQTLQTKISHDWHPATDNEVAQDKALEKANKKMVDRTKMSIGNTPPYVEN